MSDKKIFEAGNVEYGVAGDPTATTIYKGSNPDAGFGSASAKGVPMIHTQPKSTPEAPVAVPKTVAPPTTPPATPPTTPPATPPAAPPPGNPSLGLAGLPWKEIAIVSGILGLIAALIALFRKAGKSIKLRFNKTVRTLARMQKDFTVNKKGMDMRAVLPGVGSRFNDFLTRVFSKSAFRNNGNKGVMGNKSSQKMKEGVIGLYPFCVMYEEEINNDYKMAQNAFNKVAQAGEAQKSGGEKTSNESFNGKVYNSFNEAFKAGKLNESEVTNVNESISVMTGIALAGLAVRGGMFVVNKYKDGKKQKGEETVVQVTPQSTREICYAIMNNFFEKYVSFEDLSKKMGVDVKGLSDIDSSSIDKFKQVAKAYANPDGASVFKQYRRMKDAYSKMCKHYFNIGDGIIGNFKKYTKAEDEKHENLLVASTEKLYALWDQQKDQYDNLFPYVLNEIILHSSYKEYIDFIIESVIPVFKSGIAGDADYVLDVMPKENDLFLLSQTAQSDSEVGNKAIVRITKAYDSESKDIEFSFIGLYKGSITDNEDGSVELSSGDVDTKAYGNKPVTLPYSKFVALDPRFVSNAKDFVEENPEISPEVTAKEGATFVVNKDDLNELLAAQLKTLIDNMAEKTGITPEELQAALKDHTEVVMKAVGAENDKLKLEIVALLKKDEIKEETTAEDTPAEENSEQPQENPESEDKTKVKKPARRKKTASAKSVVKKGGKSARKSSSETPKTVEEIAASGGIVININAAPNADVTTTTGASTDNAEEKPEEKSEEKPAVEPAEIPAAEIKEQISQGEMSPLDLKVDEFINALDENPKYYYASDEVTSVGISPSVDENKPNSYLVNTSYTDSEGKYHNIKTVFTLKDNAGIENLQAKLKEAISASEWDGYPVERIKRYWEIANEAEEKEVDNLDAFVDSVKALFDTAKENADKHKYLKNNYRTDVRGKKLNVAGYIRYTPTEEDKIESVDLFVVYNTPVEDDFKEQTKSLNVKLKNPMTRDELVENTGFERIYYGVPSSEIISAEVKEEETVDMLNSDIINELTAKMIIEGKMEVVTSGAYIELNNEHFITILPNVDEKKSTGNGLLCALNDTKGNIISSKKLLSPKKFKIAGKRGEMDINFLENQSIKVGEESFKIKVLSDIAYAENDIIRQAFEKLKAVPPTEEMAIKSDNAVPEIEAFVKNGLGMADKEKALKQVTENIIKASINIFKSGVKFDVKTQDANAQQNGQQNAQQNGQDNGQQNGQQNDQQNSVNSSMQTQDGEKLDELFGIGKKKGEQSGPTMIVTVNTPNLDNKVQLSVDNSAPDTLKVAYGEIFVVDEKKDRKAPLAVSIKFTKQDTNVNVPESPENNGTKTISSAIGIIQVNGLNKTEEKITLADDAEANAKALGEAIVKIITGVGLTLQMDPEAEPKPESLNDSIKEAIKESIKFTVQYDVNNKVVESTAFNTGVSRKITTDKACSDYYVLSECAWSTGNDIAVKKALANKVKSVLRMHNNKIDLLEYAKANENVQMSNKFASMDYSVKKPGNLYSIIGCSLYECAVAVKFNNNGIISNVIPVGINKIN